MENILEVKCFLSRIWNKKEKKKLFVPAFEMDNKAFHLGDCYYSSKTKEVYFFSINMDNNRQLKDFHLSSLNNFLNQYATMNFFLNNKIFNSLIPIGNIYKDMDDLLLEINKYEKSINEEYLSLISKQKLTQLNGLLIFIPSKNVLYPYSAEMNEDSLEEVEPIDFAFYIQDEICYLYTFVNEYCYFIYFNKGVVSIYDYKKDKSFEIDSKEFLILSKDLDKEKPITVINKYSKSENLVKYVFNLDLINEKLDSYKKHNLLDKVYKTK